MINGCRFPFLLFPFALPLWTKAGASKLVLFLRREIGEPCRKINGIKWQKYRFPLLPQNNNISGISRVVLNIPLCCHVVLSSRRNSFRWHVSKQCRSPPPPAQNQEPNPPFAQLAHWAVITRSFFFILGRQTREPPPPTHSRTNSCAISLEYFHKQPFPPVSTSWDNSKLCGGNQLSPRFRGGGGKQFLRISKGNGPGQRLFWQAGIRIVFSGSSRSILGIPFRSLQSIKPGSSLAGQIWKRRKKQKRVWEVEGKKETK